VSGSTDWLSAIGILLAGLVLGFMFIYAFVRRRGSAAAADGVELRDLEAKRDALLQQLREVGDDAEERARLEVETAQVLRAIDERNVATGFSPSRDGLKPVTTSSSTGLRHERKGFLWGAGSVAALAFLGYFGYRALQPKDVAPAPQAAPMQQPAAQADAAIQALEARVQKTPDDLALRLELTHAYLDRENLMGVFEQTQYILQKSPNDAQAQTYQALVRMAMGQSDSALELLKSATKNDPSLVDAWVTLAWYYTQVGNRAEARAAIDQAIKRHPEQKPRLTETLQEMESQKPSAVAASGLPDAHPPVDASPAGGAIAVTVNLDAGKAALQNAVLFVMARPEGVSTGPPIAVKRIPASAFPVTVDLGSADSMMGQQFPPKVRIEARLDSDGNVMTKDPNDLRAAQDGVGLGSRVTLTLK
jgi:cytochrome c-type biogenesis protein CcmH